MSHRLLALSRSLAETYGLITGTHGGPVFRGPGGADLVCSRCGAVIGSDMGGFPPTMNCAATCPSCGVAAHLSKLATFPAKVAMLADLETRPPPQTNLELPPHYRKSPNAEFIGKVNDRIISRFLSTQLDRPRILYHYSSISSVSSILRSGSLWCSDIAYMNDSSELLYAKSLIQETSEGFLGKNIALDEIIQRSRPLNDPYAASSGYMACSFCTDGDILSQWRAYGDAGKGIALGFDSYCFDRPIQHVRRVIYDENEQRDLVSFTLDSFLGIVTEICSDGIFADLDNNGTLPALAALLNAFLSEFTFTFKHPSFSEESEWRIIVPYDRDRWISSLDFRVASDLLVPYLSLSFGDGISTPKLPLLEVVHGPTPHPELMKKSLHLTLERYNYHHVELRGSSTPLRL